MKNKITLSEDTIYTLRNLIDEIDFEESENEGMDTLDSDLVIENLYKIKDIISNTFLREGV